MRKILPFKKLLLSKAISVGLSVSIAFTSISISAASLPTGIVADSNTSAHQQAAIRAAFSSSLAMAGTAEIDPGFITLLGARVTGLDSCDGDIGLTITNAFTDGTLMKIYENFASIVSAMISVGGLIYLSSLYLQKSNPGLYNLITNGVNLGVDDFLSGIASCEAILSAASTYIPDEAIAAGKVTVIEDAIKGAKENGIDLSEIDITDFMSAEPDNVSPEDIIAKGKSFYDEDGKPSTVAGEDSESPVVSFIKAGAAAGYCILRGVDKSDCDAQGRHEEAGSFSADIVSHPMFNIMFGDDEDDYMANIQDMATKIYGEILYTDCEDCNAVNQPGMGIQRFFESQVADIASDISTRVNSSLTTMTTAKINEISAPNAIIVDMPYIQAIKMYEDRPSIQIMMIKGLAVEVAYHRIIYVSTLMAQVFQAMMTDEKTVNAKYQGQYKTFLTQNKDEYQMFIQKTQSMGFVPGRIAKLILSMSDGEGNINTITQSYNIGSN